MADAAASQSVTVTIRNSKDIVVSKRSFGTCDEGVANNTIDETSETELWFPTGMGKQPLYTIELSLVDDVCPVVLSA